MALKVEEVGGNLVVSGPYSDMVKVYPSLKSRGWGYNASNRSWYTPLAGLTPAKRKNLDKLLGQAAVPTPPPPSTESILSERRFKNLGLKSPFELNAEMKQLGALWDTHYKLWFLPDGEAFAKAKALVKVHEDKEMAIRVRERKEQQEAEEKARIEEAEALRRERAEEAARYPYTFTMGSRSKEQHPREGTTLFSRTNGKYWTVAKVKSRYIPEDGMSFGMPFDSGWSHTILCREATETEAAPVVQEEASKLRRSEAEAKLKQILHTIRQPSHVPSGTHRVHGEKLLTQGRDQILYGGGSWFVIDPGGIWYVENRGSDGDDWANNNVETGGAGGIGYRVPHDAALEATLRGLHEVLGDR